MINAANEAAARQIFDWTNEAWSITWLPWVRMAAGARTMNDEALRESLQNADEQTAEVILEGLGKTHAHLSELCSLLNSAIERTISARLH